MPNSSLSAVGEAVSIVFTKTLAVNSKASWSFIPRHGHGHQNVQLEAGNIISKPCDRLDRLDTLDTLDTLDR